MQIVILSRRVERKRYSPRGCIDGCHSLSPLNYR